MMDTCLYILESGSVTAEIDNGVGGSIRVKKFSPGSLIGELSNYTADRRRTATVVTDEASVLYHLDADLLPVDPHEKREGFPRSMNW
jgi:CRP-like cAMP-binding protein